MRQYHSQIEGLHSHLRENTQTKGCTETADVTATATTATINGSIAQLGLWTLLHCLNSNRPCKPLHDEDVSLKPNHQLAALIMEYTHHLLKYEVHICW